MQRYFDRGNKGSVTIDDFQAIINSSERPSGAQEAFSLSIEDVIKPLATKAKRYNANLGAMFEKYDTNRNNRLSADELRKALSKNNIQMSD